MPRVLVTRVIPGSAIATLRQSPHEVVVNEHDRPMTRDELLRGIPGVTGVLTQMADRVDAEFFDAAGESLRVVSNYAVGYNNIDVTEATRRGVVVCNTPGVLTEATADIAWTLLLGVARRAGEGERMVRAGLWHGWGPGQMLGGDIVGKTLLIIGAGRIGHAVARRALAWNMHIIYVARSRHEEWETQLNARRMELDEALPLADFVSLHCPLTEQTRHLIDVRRLGLMKSTAYLINTARGPVVDEAALVAVLKARRIAGAGLDVYEREPELAPGLAECDNAMLLPHLGSATVETREAMGDLAARNLLAVLAGRKPPHAVNPEVQRMNAEAAESAEMRQN